MDAGRTTSARHRAHPQRTQARVSQDWREMPLCGSQQSKSFLDFHLRSFASSALPLGVVGVGTWAEWSSGLYEV